MKRTAAIAADSNVRHFPSHSLSRKNPMTKFVTTFVAVLGAIIAASAFAVQNDTAKAVSLKKSVADFNQKSLADPIGKSQPPLTEDEVVAAIRGWIPEHTPGVTDDVYNQFQKIAESNELPEGAELSFCPGWSGYRGYSFKVWWIDLSIKTSGSAGYTFRIRDQKISSRKMTPDELQETENRDQKRSAK